VAADANDVSREITRNNGVGGGGQHGWLERTLAGLRADPAVDWIVVGFHHCAYCTNTLHGSDGGVRRWVPLFDRYGVDLVINGHNHCYERTHPLRAGVPVAEVASGATWGAANGVTYLCAGGGGGQTFPMSAAPMSTVTIDGGLRVPEPAPWSAARYNDHSLLLVDVDPGQGAGGGAGSRAAAGEQEQRREQQRRPLQEVAVGAERHLRTAVLEHAPHQGDSAAPIDHRQADQTVGIPQHGGVQGHIERVLAPLR